MDPTPTPRGLTLRHLPANDAWAFLMGEALVPVDGTRLFASRKEAETTARRCGLRPLDPRLRRWA